MKANTKIITAIMLTAGILNTIAGVLCILKMPEQVPTHFNMSWVCDGVGSRWSNLIIVALPLLIAVLSPLACKSQKEERNKETAMLSLLITIAYFIAMTWLILPTCTTGLQLGDKLESPYMDKLIPLLIGGMFIAIGNYMPTIAQNHSLSIKLPWTLKNEQCWKLTHRFAGRLWVITGLLLTIFCIIALIAHLNNFLIIYIPFFIILTLNILVPTVYAKKVYDAEVK